MEIPEEPERPPQAGRLDRPASPESERPEGPTCPYLQAISRGLKGRSAKRWFQPTSDHINSLKKLNKALFCP
jgi:hypothetical protein